MWASESESEIERKRRETERDKERERETKRRGRKWGLPSKVWDSELISLNIQGKEESYTNAGKG